MSYQYLNLVTSALRTVLGKIENELVESYDITYPKREITPKTAGELIQEFINDKSKLYSEDEQGGEGWAIKRLKTVGGSEISIVMLQSYKILRKQYDELYDLVEKKLGLKKNDEGDPLYWGHIGEPVLKMLAEHLYSTKVFGENMWLKGKFANQTYSPDGIGEINGEVVLFEFKTPFRSRPGKFLELYYENQVKLGLHTIDIANYGILISAIIRRCTFKDFNFTPAHDAEYNNDFKPHLRCNPVAIGFIIFISDSPVGMLRDSGVVVDMGSASPEETKYLFKYFVENRRKKGEAGDRLALKYSKIYIPTDNIGQLMYEVNTICPLSELKEKFIGVFPYKIMEYKEFKVEKDHDFNQMAGAALEKFFEVLNECRDDPESIRTIVYNHYFNDMLGEDP